MYKRQRLKSIERFIIVNFMRQLCRYFLLISLLLASAVLSAHNTGFTEFVFIKNQGQWHKNIEYKVQLPEGNIYIEQGRLKFHLADMSVG